MGDNCDGSLSRETRGRPSQARRHAIRKYPWIVNIVLFVLTVFTTTFAGAYMFGRQTDSLLVNFFSGWTFSLPLMAILIAHEMGHYVAGRMRSLIVTPPYFIPAVPPMGTFGAFIKIRSPITNRKVLMEVGAAGPLAGGLVAVPMLALGLSLSHVSPVAPAAGLGLEFGSSILMKLLCYIQFGDFSSEISVLRHPAATAAWFGLFVTALNLLPMGQLDGGHVICAFVGEKRARIISLCVLGFLIPMGIYYWPGWIVIGVLATVLGLRHPPPLDPYSPLDIRTKVMGAAAILLCVLTFIPVPISMIGE